MKKKIIALAMFVVMLVSAVPFSALAATNSTVYAPLGSWSNSVTCTLKNSKKNGYVKVGTNALGQNYGQKMRSTLIL